MNFQSFTEILQFSENREKGENDLYREGARQNE
jgi:hypothetical protein